MTNDLMLFIQARLNEDADRAYRLTSGWPREVEQGKQWLRSIEAKRQILKEHRSIRPPTEEDWTKGECASCCNYAYDRLVPWPCLTVRLIASEWSDHPDYLWN